MKELPSALPGVSNWTMHRLENTLTDLKEIMERGHPRDHVGVIAWNVHAIAVELLSRCKQAHDREAWQQGVLACDNCTDLARQAPRCPNCRTAAPL